MVLTHPPLPLPSLPLFGLIVRFLGPGTLRGTGITTRKWINTLKRDTLHIEDISTSHEKHLQYLEALDKMHNVSVTEFWYKMRMESLESALRISRLDEHGGQDWGEQKTTSLKATQVL